MLWAERRAVCGRPCRVLMVVHVVELAGAVGEVAAIVAVVVAIQTVVLLVAALFTLVVGLGAIVATVLALHSSLSRLGLPLCSRLDVAAQVEIGRRV